MKSSALSALALYIAAVLLSFYLFLFNFKGPFHLNGFYITAIVVSDLILLYVGSAYLSKSMTKKASKDTRNLSLLAMALALVIYLISNFVYFTL
jgi:uncharacterized membrane protein